MLRDTKFCQNGLQPLRFCYKDPLFLGLQLVLDNCEWTTVWGLADLEAMRQLRNDTCDTDHLS